uniref:nucleotide sugar dehydrogenase n=1 Tax=Limnohabitans sp. TaxID=1907725 RepID=UPI004048A9D9
MKIGQGRIAVIGLGYVGLPLAVAFSKSRSVIGFDIDEKRIAELRSNLDRTGEMSSAELSDCQNLRFTQSELDLDDCDVYIVTVPTPVTADYAPDLSILKKASATVARHVKRNGLVIYESTVYPGCTEEECVPILESISGLRLGKDLYCGYSPERINPGDANNKLATIKKVTSGSCYVAALAVDALYKEIIIAGTVPVSSIKVAEASKVIENAQRDVNISFVNELALIFDRLDIDTTEVLEAAATKWNFQFFRPGLVGGHCISVDPYYLAHKAERVGYHPEVILSGRRVNNRMASFIASKTVKLMIRKGLVIRNSRALVLGITFKENCPDIRNSKVVEIISELKEFGIDVDVYDPVADAEEVGRELSLPLKDHIPQHGYDAIILAVAHSEFLSLDIGSLKKSADSVVFDVKSSLNRDIVDARL